MRKKNATREWREVRELQRRNCKANLEKETLK